MAARKRSLGRIGKYWLNISVSFLLSEQLVLLNELSRKVLSGFKLVQTEMWEKKHTAENSFPLAAGFKKSSFSGSFVYSSDS